MNFRPIYSTPTPSGGGSERGNQNPIARPGAGGVGGGAWRRGDGPGLHDGGRRKDDSRGRSRFDASTSRGRRGFFCPWRNRGELLGKPPARLPPEVRVSGRGPARPRDDKQNSYDRSRWTRPLRVGSEVGLVLPRAEEAGALRRTADCFDFCRNWHQLMARPQTSASPPSPSWSSPSPLI